MNLTVFMDLYAIIENLNKELNDEIVQGLG